MAAVAYPFLHSIPPQRFVRLVCAGELVLGDRAAPDAMRIFDD
jgi:hypothetical protein